jgi:hypothetical protein
MGLIVICLHRRFLERPVHAFDLAIGPRMVGFGQPRINPILLADAIKDMMKGLDIALAIGELDAIISEHRVDLIGDGGHHVPEELSGDHFVGFCMQLGIGKLTGAVNGDQQGELAFFRADLGDVDMEVPIG